MNNSWENTREALKAFADILMCEKCGSKPTSPIRYSNCEHFFCVHCTGTETTCSKCQTPVLPNEMHPDHMVANFVRYCDMIAEIINETSLWSNKDVTNISMLSNLSKLTQNTSVRKSIGKTVPKSLLKNINKRNPKGETALHTACIKQQEDYIKSLLAVGADPNTKDNANWTPLQEVVNMGFYNICEILLQAGASPNTPGFENKTALHEAVIHNKIEEMKLLLHYHADKDVYDQYGKRPIDYCHSDQIRKILSEDNEEKTPEKVLDLNRTLDQSISFASAKLVVLASNLKDQNQILLSSLVLKHKIKVTSIFRSCVTHVVVEVNDQNVTNLSYDVMMAILRGNWILNTTWISLSLELNDISEIQQEIFEVNGAPIEGIPKRARENMEKQNPRLFNGCYFYFATPVKNIYIDNIELTKESLIKLVTEGEGNILSREPDPEDIKEGINPIPFHTAHSPSHPLHKCTHYIIYVPGKEEPRIKYNMPHIKTLPLIWLIECIEKFMLIDPTHLGLS